MTPKKDKPKVRKLCLSLTEKQVEFLESLVNDGTFASRSSAVAQGVRLLMDQERGQLAKWREISR